MIWDPTHETMPREKLRSVQSMRLRAQVAYVYERSAFYRAKMDALGLRPEDIRSVADVALLPFTTKDELRRSQEVAPPFGEHVCATPEEIVWLPSTSGTSGRPLMLPRTAHDIDVWSDLGARGFVTTGLTASDIHLHVMPYHWILGGLMSHQGGVRAGIAMINGGVGNTAKQLWALTELGPTSFHATPSYLSHVANKLHESGDIERLKLHTILAGGEVGMAGAEAKKRLARMFPGVRTFADVGGVTDIGTMTWAECPEAAGGHLFEDSVLVEVLDPETLEPVPPGTVGEVVYTDLVSRGAPLLRYRVRDLTWIDETPCGCGRTLARMPEGVLGRSDDMITLRSGNVFPSAIDELVKSVPELSGNYQVVVHRPAQLDEMIIRVESHPEGMGAAEGLRSRLAERFRLSLNSRVEVEVHPPGVLPEFAVKARRIIDKRRGDTEETAARIAREQSGDAR